jgi:hypothetical protein
MPDLRPDVFGSRPPVFMVEVAEIPRTPCLFVEVSEGDVQADGTISGSGRVEDAGLHFEAGVESDGPFDDVAAAGSRRCFASLRPNGRALTWRTIEPEIPTTPSELTRSRGVAEPVHYVAQDQ